MTTRSFAVALACATALAGFSSGARGGARAADLPVGYANMADTDVFVMARKQAFIAAAKADPQVKVQFADANNDVSKQLDQIDNFLAGQVKVLVVVPADYQGIVPAVEKANDAKVPVIALGNQVGGGQATFVGSREADAGRMQAGYMHDHLPKNAQIVYLEGTLGLYNTGQRLDGFKTALNRPDVKLLAVQTGNYTRDGGMQVVEDWIQSFPHIDAVVAANDQMALGAIQALKSANRLQGVMVSGIDGTADGLKAIQAGDMTQSIFQNAKGQAQAAFAVVEDIKNGKPAPAEKLIPFESITKDNVRKYM